MEASGINILDIISKKPHSTLNCHKDLVKNSQDGSQRITKNHKESQDIFMGIFLGILILGA